MAMPHIPSGDPVFLASRTYPSSPHIEPQEFFTIQYSADPFLALLDGDVVP